MPRAGGLFNFKHTATAYSILPEDYNRLPLFAVDQNNRVLNEFAFYCLKRLHKLQNFGNLKVTCNDTAGVQAHFASLSLRRLLFRKSQRRTSTPRSSSRT